MNTDTVADLVERIRAGEPGAIARGISWCEAGGDRAERLLHALGDTRPHLIGLTGSPGAGKSTLVNALVRSYRASGARIGVVAVDPTSPVSGGALLGDRVRLDHQGSDGGLFFRSLATRAAAGGLSNAARGTARVLATGGFAPVLIETVGAGQAEVEIMRVADTVIVVLNPGAGDEMQALKAGIMEIADVFVLNKGDLPGMGELKSHVAAMLHLRDAAAWTPPLVVTVASEHKGIDDLRAVIDRHWDHLAGGLGAERGAASRRAEALRLARARIDEALRVAADGVFPALDRGEVSEPEAARLILDEALRAIGAADGVR